MPEMLTKNFSRKELSCPCCNECYMDRGMLASLQDLRDKWNNSLGINSAYRCAKHNATVGGKQASRHLVGDAVDISNHNMNAHEKYEFLKLLIQTGWTGIGLHRDFFHADKRPGLPIIWYY